MSVSNALSQNDSSAYPVRFRYEALRSLMNSNVLTLKILGDLGADLNHARCFDPKIRRPIQQLIHKCYLMAQELNLITGNRYEDLYDVLGRIRSETERLCVILPDKPGESLCVPLSAPAALDHRQVGAKAAMLARIRKHMPESVPEGTVVTAKGYRLFLDQNDLSERIRLLIHNMDVRSDPETFSARTRTIRDWVMNGSLSDDLRGALAQAAGEGPWMVRASAVSDDPFHTFPGLFDSVSGVSTQDLAGAYVKILASRFSDKASAYRIHGGFREVDTPMAVLVMPMIDISAQGSLYTCDVNEPGEIVTVIHPKDQNADFLVKGSYVNRPEGVDGLSDDLCLALARLGQAVKQHLGRDMAVEWAVDSKGGILILQAEYLDIAAPEKSRQVTSHPSILAMGGISIFSGRSEGPALFLKSPSDFTPGHKGAIVVVEEALPEFGAILPEIAALLVIKGHPTDALASMARELSVPTIFQLGPVARRLVGKHCISVNTMKRAIYSGSRWPGIRERVMARIAESNQNKNPSPMFDHILRQTLTEPDSSSFKAKNCTSIQDAVMFMHEMTVRSMFGFGDQQTGWFGSQGSRLKTTLPLKCQVIDIDHSAAVAKKNLMPEEIVCQPFNALWKGISDPNVIWTQHWKHEMAGLHQDLRAAVLDSDKGPRRQSDMNYVIVSRDNMNFNARLFHHLIMIDSHVGPGTDNNYIHVRVRGCGGIGKNRSRSISFVENVLGRMGFGLDRKGDIVTAWIGCYGQKESSDILESLGRLLVCVRELDAVLKNDTDIARYADHFFKGSYSIFA